MIIIILITRRVIGVTGARRVVRAGSVAGSRRWTGAGRPIENKTRKQPKQTTSRPSRPARGGYVTPAVRSSTESERTRTPSARESSPPSDGRVGRSETVHAPSRGRGGRGRPQDMAPLKVNRRRYRGTCSARRTAVCPVRTARSGGRSPGYAGIRRRPERRARRTRATGRWVRARFPAEPKRFNSVALLFFSVVPRAD